MPPLALPPHQRRPRYAPLFDREFLVRYFRSRVSGWFPGFRLHHLRILGVRSQLVFKQRAAYALTLLDRRGRESCVTVRATVPSADRMFELPIAYRALAAIQRCNQRGTKLPAARPLAIDRNLHAFFYVDVTGIPLETALMKHSPGAMRGVAASARWLARFHGKKLKGGHPRSERDERRERIYFALNYGRFYPPCHDPAVALLTTFFRVRRAHAAEIRRSATLCHGDYNPGNVILNGNRISGVIDFGNAIQYDPMADLANAVLQLGLLGWRSSITTRQQEEAQRLFLSSYRTAMRSRAVATERFYLFSIWWSMQALSYILSIGIMKNKRPVIDALLRYGRASEQLLLNNPRRLQVPRSRRG